MIRQLKRILQLLQSKGLNNYLSKTITLLIKTRLKNFSNIQYYFEGKSGLEIGGPSCVFQKKGFIPVYPIIKNLDGCNFWYKTVWEGELSSGKNYRYEKNKIGYQYISEATNLDFSDEQKYDFLISSNCLEHIANPLKAVKEWIRVLKNGGLLVLVLPNKAFNFDHKRKDTTFSHLLADYQNDVNEDDLTHLEEILVFHDLKIRKPYENFDHFKERCFLNRENRTMHHHIFNTELLKEICEYFNLEILLVEGGYENIIVGKKKS